MINLVINNIKVQAPVGSTILQACANAGIEIPRFCYHEKLSIAGNCRMCLVEVGKSLKPVASCAMPVSNDMVINTNTVLVKKAREGVLEFLLANHPLDCPICDQGGECDLQDQSMVFGSDRGRFYEYKRAVEDKNFGPFVKTVMTRCIHCTRCVRFSTEIAGVSVLGTTGRGSHTEIGSYIQKLFSSELSGNVIDLCPVGALTSKPYAFTARSWELKSVETFDVFDPIVPSIRVDVRGPEIMRILPRLNESTNEEWISDKTRFFYDGLKRQRLTLPLIKYPLVSNNTLKTSVFISFSWESVLKWMDFFLKAFMSGKENITSVIPVLGSGVDYLTVLSTKKFFNLLGYNKFLVQQSFVNNLDFYKNFVFSRSFNSLKEFDALVLVGLNLRLESPVLNSRVRNLVNHSGLEVFSFGVPFNLTYKSYNVSNSSLDLINLMLGKHFLSTYFSKKKVLFVFGNSFFQEHNFSFFLNLKSIGYNNFSFEYFSNVPSNINAWDLGLKVYTNNQMNSLKKKSNLFYIVGADNLDFSFSSRDFVVYQGHHGDRTAFKANIILPTPVFTERSAFFPNIQGIFNRTNKVLNTVNMARMDYRIFQALLLTILKKNNFIKNINFLPSLFFFSKHLPNVNVPSKILLLSNFDNVEKSLVNYCSISSARGFSSLISNFYRTDCISRASVNMSSAAKAFLHLNVFWRN